MSVLVDGDPSAPVLIMGMAPGRDEMAQGAPFVGPSGALLWQAMARAGMGRSDCYIINTIGEIQHGAKPTPEQLGKYWDEVNEALQAATPCVVITLGGDATERLLGPGYRRITDWRGYLIPASDVPRLLVRPDVTFGVFKSGKRKGQPKPIISYRSEANKLPDTVQYIVPTIHPSSVLRSGFKTTPAFFYDVERAVRAAQGNLQKPKVPPVHALCFDIENAVLPTGWGAVERFGWQELPFGQAKSRRWDSTVRLEVAPLLDDPDLEKIGYNITHDICHLQAEGVSVRGPLIDVMLGCQLLQPDLYKGLNATASLYLDVPRWKHLSGSDPETYNRLDVQRTSELWGAVREFLMESGQMPTFQREMAALPSLIDMRIRGIRVFEAKANEMYQEYYRQRDEHMRRFQDHFPGVSPRSPVQLLATFKARGWKVKDTEESTLKLLHARTDDPGLYHLLQIRKLNKHMDYVKPVLWPDGRVHPNYLPAAKDSDDGEGKGMAGTGRIQARDPNIQQIPKDIRCIFIPDPGKVFIEADFDQAELRVAAALSGDDSLRHALDGPDLHQHHADLWRCTRPEAKTVTYATLYGAGAHKLQLTFTKAGRPKSLRECERLLQSFYATYPKLAAWRQELIYRIQTDKRLINPFGRQRFFWNPSKDVPAGLDFNPQSTVADIVWDRIPHVASVARVHGGRLTNVVHDSFLIQVSPEAAADAAVALRSTLQAEFPQVAPDFFLPVTVKQGPDWGNLRSIP